MNKKIMTMNGELHPKGDVDRLYVTRMKGGRGLISCESCISSEKNNLGWYLDNATEQLLIGAKTVGVNETKETVSKMKFRKSWTNVG